MGFSEAFTPLSLLTLGEHRLSRVRVRVSRRWVAFSPLDGVIFGLQCILIDDEGVMMQALASPTNMKRLQQQIIEGRVYALSDFIVISRLNKYMACSNDLMIKMGEQTVVEEREEDDFSPIPTHTFEFVDFDDVPCRIGDDSSLTDVIGQIISIEDEGQVWKWKLCDNIPFRNIHLKNLRGESLRITLFGELACNFDKKRVRIQGRRAPVVAVFAGMSVKDYPRIARIGLTVCSSPASKYYLNLEIPESHQFCASLLRNGRTLINQVPCQVQNPVNPTELVNKWRTIEQLKSLNPHELPKPTLCKATFKGIDCTKDWCYWSCSCCKKSMDNCVEDLSNYRSAVRSLDAVMEDITGTMNIMIFGGTAQELVVAPAEDLTDVTADKISAVVGSGRERAFEVAFENGRFVAKHFLNDDMLQLVGSTQMSTAGGSGLLSQEDGSFASSTYSCSSQVNKKVNVLMEDERDLKRLKTTDEAEQRCNVTTSTRNILQTGLGLSKS